MKPVFTKEEQLLLKARTPKEYIDKSLKCRVSPGRKAFVTRFWLDSKRYTIDDIKYARNRHPYWKAKKMEGTAERNAIRTEQHNYSTGKNIEWDEKLIKRFLDDNKKDKKGQYVKKDWELARQYKCTIPAIQHMRRKYNMAEKIITNTQGKITAKRLMDLLILGEGTLRKMAKKRKRR